MDEQKIAFLIQQEIDCLQVLLKTLQDEYDLLASNDIESLEQSADVKNSALQNQLIASNSRRKTIQQTDFSGDPDDLNAFIASFETDSDLSKLSLQLHELAQQCKEANRTNGKLIFQRENYLKGAINVIRRSDQASPLYSGKGSEASGQTTRSLGKA